MRPVEHWTLTQRNVYIVPTPAGWAFGLTLLLLLITSINYQLNLGFGLTFLLAGSALASIHMTHASLRGLSFHVRPPAGAFSGERVELSIVITNPGGTRHGIGWGLASEWGAAPPTWAEVASQTQSTVVIAYQAGQRGRHELPALRAESRFPFGLFRAWTVWRPAGQLWVYPAPERPCPALPALSPVAGSEQAAKPSPSGEFDGVRPWRSGDSLRQVVWKKMARTGELVSRDGRESARADLWLDWSVTRLTGHEERLSRLCAWVLEAQARQLRYGLSLPNRQLACSDEPGQQAKALQMLAES